jgi:hypothetical protein
LHDGVDFAATAADEEASAPSILSIAEMTALRFASRVARARTVCGLEPLMIAEPTPRTVSSSANAFVTSRLAAAASTKLNFMSTPVAASCRAPRRL